MSQGLQRALYSLAMSAAIILPLSTVLGGLVCRATAAFDYQNALMTPLILVTAGWFAFLPMLLVLALVVFALVRVRENLWRGKPLATLFVVPAAILLGLGSFSVMLARGPGAGCF